MNLLETHIQSFIIKIWVEDGDGKGPALWHGRITHVPSGECGYLRDLHCIELFMAPYLKRMGVRVGVGWRIRRWLRF